MLIFQKSTEKHADILRTHTLQSHLGQLGETGDKKEVTSDIQVQYNRLVFKSMAFKKSDISALEKKVIPVTTLVSVFSFSLEVLP